jgi:hypothetical protein
LKTFDVVDLPLDLRSGSSISGVVATMSEARGELTGILQAPGRQPAPAVPVAFTMRLEWGEKKTQGIRIGR